MVAIRHILTNPSSNLEKILGLINHGHRERVILFVTAVKADDIFNPGIDGFETNLPLIAALVEYTIPGIDKVHVVFDGLFLTAARQPRYGEVKTLLDTAENSKNIFFSVDRVPFTSSLSPDAAAETLLKSVPLVPFSAESRAKFVMLLTASGLSEMDLAN